MTDYEKFLNTPISNETMEQYLQYFSQKQLRYHHIDELLSFTVDELFDDVRRAFVLLFVENSGQNVGHWVLLLRRSTNELEHFDSLGSKKEYYAEGGIYSKIREFCIKENCSLSFNVEQCQGDKSFTCARWSILRTMTQHFTNKEFFSFLRRNVGKSIEKYDKFVVDLIRFY